MRLTDADSANPAASSGNVYRAVYAAIKVRDLEGAHNLLRGLIRERSADPDYLLLMAWTAPTQRTAQLIFRQFQRSHPNHPKAKGEVMWSGVAWARPTASVLAGEAAAPTTTAAARVEAPAAVSAVPAPVRQAQGAGGARRVRPVGLAEWLGQVNFYTYLGIYMAGITLAEVMTTFVNPLVGLVVHGGLLLLILMHTALAEPGERKLLLALALAPLIRLMSLSMPLLEFEFKYWYMVIGLPLLFASVVVYRLSGYRRTQVGLALGKDLPLQLLVATAGVGLGYLEYYILKPEPLVDSFSLQSVWLPAVILLVFTGFLEELIFRGLMQRAAVDQLRKLGPFYISLLFAVLHIGYKSLIDLAFVFLVGFAFSLVATRTRSLLGVTISHGLTNISLFLIFPFLLAAPLQPNVIPSALPGVLVQTAQPTQLAQPTPTVQVEIIGPAMWVSPPTLTPQPTYTPTVTATVTQTPTATRTPTALPPSPTASPTATWYFVPPPTAIATWTLMPTATWTNTPLPTATVTLVNTPTATPTVPPTATPTAEAVLVTSVPIPPTATATPLPTATELPAPTATETPSLFP